MAPEEVYYLVALRMRFEGGQLVADGERVLFEMHRHIMYAF